MLDTLESTARRASAGLPSSVSHWAVRAVSEVSEQLAVRQGVAEAPRRSRDEGVMLTVVDGSGMGYAATSDTSQTGLRDAFAKAHALARASAGKTVFDYAQAPRPVTKAVAPIIAVVLRKSRRLDPPVDCCPDGLFVCSLIVILAPKSKRNDLHAAPNAGESKALILLAQTTKFVARQLSDKNYRNILQI